jgi:hypothetical protein
VSDSLWVGKVAYGGIDGLWMVRRAAPWYNLSVRLLCRVFEIQFTLLCPSPAQIPSALGPDTYPWPLNAALYGAGNH